MTFIAGAFDALWGAQDIGQVKDGFTIEYFAHKQLITGDKFGRAPQDAVNLGLECFVEFTLIDWPVVGTQKLVQLLWPHSLAGDGASFTHGDVGVIGELDSKNVEALQLTAKTGTSSAGLTAETQWIFTLSILAEGFPVRLLLSPELREVPLRLRVYPNTTTGVFFTRAATA